jgi:hypothetical protein
MNANGFKQIFGNFHGEWTRGWDRRRASPCVIGGETSSWCRSDEYTLGHDGIIGDFWFSALVLWDKKYDENQYEKYHAAMRRELPRIRELLTDRPSLTGSLKPKQAKLLYAAPPGGKYKIRREDLPDLPVFDQLTLPDETSGKLLGESETFFNADMKADRLLFVHTSLAERRLSLSYNFESDWCPVIYAVRYNDGETVFINARFGDEIGNIKMKSGRHLNYRGVTPEDGGGYDTNPEECPDPPLYILNDLMQNALIYSASPFYAGDYCLYIQEWINPRPDIAIEKIYAINVAQSKSDQALLYFVAAVSE